MIYDIRNYGAVGDGVTLNTKALQSAINACTENGGGRVLVENGVYMFGSIQLFSNVELHIAAGATLLGSPRCEDYPEKTDIKHVDSARMPRWQNASYIFCEESENVSITGMGKIDCNGTNFVEPGKGVCDWSYKRIDAPTPPRVVFFTGCKNVSIQGITMVNQPAGWSYWIHDCDLVTVDGIKIFAEVEYPNNDGVHINSSRNVTVSNCNIVCGDDCIVVRANNATLPENKVCERVTVTNCNLTSYASGIRIGWKNDGVIRNCTFSNVVMTDTSVGIGIVLPGFKFDPDNRRTADTGREATLIERLSFDNIVMDGTYGEPVEIKIENAEDTYVTAVRDISFSNIRSSGPRGMLLRGREDAPIENLRFSNCVFEITDYSYWNGSPTHGGRSIKTDHGPYPKIEHCDGLALNNVEFRIKK